MTMDDIKPGLCVQGGNGDHIRLIKCVRMHTNDNTSVQYDLYLNKGSYFVLDAEYTKGIGDLFHHFAKKEVHTFINNKGYLEIL